MKNENLDDKGQFKMRLDEEEGEETPLPPHVGDLRFEKLNTRVTMITILIPVLIVLVLAIAYMDIKKRVIQTEDTGQLTAESLSKELESRFSSVAQAQKVLEENMARLKDQSDKSVAKVQINLKKLDDRLKKSTKNMASQSDIQTAKVTLSQSVNNLSQGVDDIKIQLGQITETLQPQIAAVEKALAENKTQMSQLEERLNTFDADNIDKEKLGVVLKLEMLKIKNAYKDRFEEIQSRITSLEGKISKRAASAPSRPSSSPTPAVLPPQPPPSQNGSPAAPQGGLQEQTIGK